MISFGTFNDIDSVTMSCKERTIWDEVEARVNVVQQLPSPLTMKKHAPKPNVACREFVEASMKSGIHRPGVNIATAIWYLFWVERIAITTAASSATPATARLAELYWSTTKTNVPTSP